MEKNTKTEVHTVLCNLPLVRREWRNGGNGNYHTISGLGSHGSGEWSVASRSKNGEGYHNITPI